MDSFTKAEIKFIEIDKVCSIIDKVAEKGILSYKAADLLIHEIYKATDPNMYKKP